MAAPTHREDISTSDEVKDLLDRWGDECPEILMEPQLWAALNARRFRNIRLRYEKIHHLWQFSFRLLGNDRVLSGEVERVMRDAFAKCGHPIEKEFLAAVVEGGRVRGGFILRPRRIKNVCRRGPGASLPLRQYYTLRPAALLRFTLLRGASGLADTRGNSNRARRNIYPEPL